MPHEPADAPVPDGSKGKFYIGLVVAIVVIGALTIFVFPNLIALTDEGPAVEDEFEVQTPGGTEPIDGGDPDGPELPTGN